MACGIDDVNTGTEHGVTVATYVRRAAVCSAVDSPCQTAHDAPTAIGCDRTVHLSQFQSVCGTGAGSNDSDRWRFGIRSSGEQPAGMSIVPNQTLREAPHAVEPEGHSQISELPPPRLNIHGHGCTDTFGRLDPVALDRVDNPFGGNVTVKKPIDTGRCETGECKAGHRV
jgi:hypothetical protein